MLKTFVVLCLIGMCVAASVLPTPIEITNDDLAAAESANPQFGFFPGGGYGQYGGGRGFGHRHQHGYGGYGFPGNGGGYGGGYGFPGFGGGYNPYYG